MGYPLPKFNSSPLKSYLPHRKGSSSNHHLSGSMLNFRGCIGVVSPTDPITFGSQHVVRRTNPDPGHPNRPTSGTFLKRLPRASGVILILSKAASIRLLDGNFLYSWWWFFANQPLLKKHAPVNLDHFPQGSGGWKLKNVGVATT